MAYESCKWRLFRTSLQLGFFGNDLWLFGTFVLGHGGDGFLKFQDNEEISDIELADAFQQMWEKKRYNQILFMIDTCQAASMYKKHYSPNIVSIASSQVGQDSYSVCG